MRRLRNPRYAPESLERKLSPSGFPVDAPPAEVATVDPAPQYSEGTDDSFPAAVGEEPVIPPADDPIPAFGEDPGVPYAGDPGGPPPGGEPGDPPPVDPVPPPDPSGPAEVDPFEPPPEDPYAAGEPADPTYYDYAVA